MMALAKDIGVQGELRFDEPMSRHTSWRAGGPADVFFIPASVDDLAVFLRELDRDTPVFWLGVGSNLLVRDGGIRGVVVAATQTLRKLERVDTYRVRAGAGLPCTQLARQCIRWGLGPSEFFAGIPGTVGGALAMNAGAHGGSPPYARSIAMVKFTSAPRPNTRSAIAVSRGRPTSGSSRGHSASILM